MKNNLYLIALIFQSILTSSFGQENELPIRGVAIAAPSVCDWHYERPLQTPVAFAMKGLEVISCSWNKPQVGIKQVEDMYRFREHNTPRMKERFKGVMLTVWMGAESFLDGFYEYQKNPEASTDENKEWVTFIRMFERIHAMALEN